MFLKILQPHLAEGRDRLLELGKNRAGRFEVFDPVSEFYTPSRLSGEIELYDYYDKRITLPARVACAEPNLDKGATELELSYIQEILRRVGMGGIPYYVPIDSGLQRLTSVIQGLEIFSNYLAFKNGKSMIDSNMMTDSIRNTDTRIMDLLVV